MLKKDETVKASFIYCKLTYIYIYKMKMLLLVDVKVKNKHSLEPLPRHTFLLFYKTTQVFQALIFRREAKRQEHGNMRK